MLHLWEDWVDAEGFKNGQDINPPPHDNVGSQSVLDAELSDMPKYMKKGGFNGVSSVTNNLIIHNEKTDLFLSVWI